MLTPQQSSDCALGGSGVGAVIQIRARVPGLLAILIAVYASAGELDQLAKDVAGPDALKRAHARQLLPRYGVSAIDPLLPMLSSDDAGVRGTAFNIVADIANLLASPGHQDDRVVASQTLLALVAPEQPEHVKWQGLRLLSIVVPEGFDLTPVAVLLDDPAYRERAREALVLMGTGQACRMLVHALAKCDPVFSVAASQALGGGGSVDDPAFAVALLDGLGTIQRPELVDPISKHLNSPHAEVESAAARAISWSGDVRFVDAMRKVVANAPERTRFEATDALLRFGEAMARNGGNWSLATRLFEEVLSDSPQTSSRAAAMMALSRYGDASAVPALVAAAGKDRDLAAPVVQALAGLQGGEAVKRVLAEYPALPSSAKIGLLSVWGQRGELAAVDLMKAELSNGAAEIRAAALNALAATGSMQAFPALVEVAQTGSDKERRVALDAVEHMAGTLDSAGNKEAAGLAYVRLFQLTRSDEVRLDVLHGISRCPVPQAFEIAREALGADRLKEAAVKALAAVTPGLAASGDRDRCRAAIELLRDSGATPQQLVQVAASVSDPELTGELSSIIGAIGRWKVIGPFAWKSDEDWSEAFVSEPTVQLSGIRSDDETMDWKDVQGAKPQGNVDLISALGQHEKCFAYAYAEIVVNEAVTAELRLGSDDGVVAWVNAKQVWENRVDRGMKFDQDAVEVELDEGKNTILLKISQGGGGWGFCARVSDKSGIGIPFTQPGSGE
jgi:HEAT repeat protein